MRSVRVCIRKTTDRLLVFTIAAPGAFGAPAYLVQTATSYIGLMSAQFCFPRGIALGLDGTLYVADTLNHCIRMIRDNQVTTLAGTKEKGFRDGPAAQALFNEPRSVAVGPDGAVYVADSYNHRVRKILNGQVTTVAGDGVQGLRDGHASQARFSYPRSIALGPDGTLYVADARNNCIRAIAGSEVSTFAGTGTEGHADGPAAQATFSYPSAVAVDPDDSSVIVADYSNNCIRMIRNNIVSTIAGRANEDGGFADGPAPTAMFDSPSSVALGRNNTIIVADSLNRRIRTIVNTQVATLAGEGIEGHADGPAAQTRFKQPEGVACGPDGTVFLSDSHRIRMIRDNQVTTIAGGRTAGFADGPTLVEIPKTAAKTIDLLTSIDVSADLSLQIHDATLQLHQAFIQHRCPKLLKSSLRVHPVDAVSIDLFRAYLYTDQLPDADLSLQAQAGLSFLLQCADMKQQALTLLSRLQRYPWTKEQQQNLNMQDLVQLYSYCLDLGPFDDGLKVAVYLLRRHSSLLGQHLPSVPQWLGKHADKLISLMQELLKPMDSLQPPITAEKEAAVNDRGSCLSLQSTLEALHRDRQRSGDFEIAIKGAKTKRAVKKAKKNDAEIVHSFVLYAMWPYFRHMYDSGLKEKHQRRLELPGVGEDGGLTEELLQLIIELCYKPSSALQISKERVTAEMSMQLLPVAQMYLADEGDAHQGPLSQLFEFAEQQLITGVTLEQCIQLHLQALQYGLARVVASTRRTIVRNLKTLTSNPERFAELRALPSEALSDLLRESAEKWD